MLKVLLLLAVLDKGTGDILSVWSPVPGFETMKECTDALSQAKAQGLPPGVVGVIAGRCVDSRELASGVST